MDEGRAGIGLDASMAVGAVLGGVIAALIAPLIRPLFHAPTGGIGFVTVHHYPKSWDYAVVALLVIGSFAGASLLRRLPARGQRVALSERSESKGWVRGIPLIVFILVFLIQDRPNEPLDFFHEGEHLTPAFLLSSGERPYRDVFFHHGLASDGGLEVLVPGATSVRGSRRLETILGAATLALIPLIAAEVCATTGGVALATLASLSATGVGVMRMFPYFRLAPVMLAALGLLRYVGTRRTAPLALAMLASTLGVLWSIDTGLFALVGTLAVMIAIRPPLKTLATVAAIAVALPIIVLLLVRADLRQFAIDSFILIPRAADAIGSLPAPDPPHRHDFLFWLADEPGRYYVPLIVYGFLFALALRFRSARILILTTFSLLLFRAAAGRVDVRHIRFALPLLGIMAVAFIIEPLVMRARVVATIVVSLLFIVILDVVPNVTGSAKEIWTWPARQGEMTAMPDVAELDRYVRSLGPQATFVDFSNERALYYLLRRKPPVRCPDMMMLSSPSFLAEAMAQLRAQPPSCVVLEGYVGAFDGIPSGERVPEIGRWIDANYPRRLHFGRFLVAAK